MHTLRNGGVQSSSPNVIRASAEKPMITTVGYRDALSNTIYSCTNKHSQGRWVTKKDTATNLSS